MQKYLHRADEHQAQWRDFDLLEIDVFRWGGQWVVGHVERQADMLVLHKGGKYPDLDIWWHTFRMLHADKRFLIDVKWDGGETFKPPEGMVVEAYLTDVPEIYERMAKENMKVYLVVWKGGSTEFAIDVEEKPEIFADDFKTQFRWRRRQSDFASTMKRAGIYGGARIPIEKSDLRYEATVP